MNNKDIDAQFLCKDCTRYNLCEYYHRRRKDSYICKYFHLSVTPQEPQTSKWCTDCREYDQEKHCCHRWSKVIRDTVEEMKQEPKTGHWIPTYGNVKCSVCGSVKDSREVGKATHYCDFCGAKMVEPQESEDI